MRWKFSKTIKILISLFVICSVFTFVINFYILEISDDFIYNDLEDLPTTQTALVLGAKVRSNGQLSDILKDRADTALQIYQAGKVKKILLSGDHGTVEYDEVNALKNYFLDNGVLAEDIFLDHAGFDTYDSLYRARDIFLAKDLIVVTQNFHLPRAVYIGRALGLETYGFSADKHQYIDNLRLGVREIPARIKAFFSILFKTEPKYLGSPIPLTGSSQLSWD